MLTVTAAMSPSLRAARRPECLQDVLGHAMSAGWWRRSAVARGRCHAWWASLPRRARWIPCSDQGRSWNPATIKLTIDLGVPVIELLLCWADRESLCTTVRSPPGRNRAGSRGMPILWVPRAAPGT